MFTIHDGDQEPLANLKVLLWGRREAILSVWPAANELKLWVVEGEQYGHEERTLKRFRSRLLEAPWKES
ncbi:MAG: hypothetical protein HY716_08470 [Planctomycetes bacterium]|nr:hypothetical protein [Planctomycetota bacterium]